MPVVVAPYFLFWQRNHADDSFRIALFLPTRSRARGGGSKSSRRSSQISRLGSPFRRRRLLPMLRVEAAQGAAVVSSPAVAPTSPLRTKYCRSTYRRSSRPSLLSSSRGTMKRKRYATDAHDTYAECKWMPIFPVGLCRTQGGQVCR